MISYDLRVKTTSCDDDDFWSESILRSGFLIVRGRGLEASSGCRKPRGLKLLLERSESAESWGPKT